MNFEKFQLKWKIVKHFTRPKQRAALRKLFSLHQPPIPPDKILLNLWNKNFLREVYRNIQTFAFKVLQESSSWASGNGAVQMFFLTPNRSIFFWKILKMRKFFGCVLGAYYFQFQRSWDSQNERGFLKWNCNCKINDLFHKFLLALRFSATKSGI